MRCLAQAASVQLESPVSHFSAVGFQVGSDEPVNMTSTVFRLANKTLRLDRIKG